MTSQMRVQCHNYDRCLHADQLCMSCTGNLLADDVFIDHYEHRPLDPEKEPENGSTCKEPGGEGVLVSVKNWIRDQKNLTSSSFRATIVRQTEKAVMLRLKDGQEIWVPWSAVTSMEDK